MKDYLKQKLQRWWYYNKYSVKRFFRCFWKTLIVLLVVSINIFVIGTAATSETPLIICLLFISIPLTIATFDAMF